MFTKLQTEKKVYNKTLVADVSWLKSYLKIEEARAEEVQLEEESDSDSEEDQAATTIDPRLKEQLDDIMIEDTFLPDQQANTKWDSQDFVIVEEDQQKEKPIYERLATEGKNREHLDLQSYQHNQLHQMEKRERQLLLFSDVDLSSYADLNQNRMTKTWAVINHFGTTVDFDHPVYEEFKSVIKRNVHSKVNSHSVYKLLFQEISQSMTEQSKLKKSPTCNQSGMIFDLSINKPNRERLGLYFLLKEDLCLHQDAERENQHEPLGVQKLLMKQLKNRSEYDRIVSISEPEVLESTNLKNLVKYHFF